MGLLDAIDSFFSPKQQGKPALTCKDCWFSGYLGKICKQTNPPSNIRNALEAVLCIKYTVEAPNDAVSAAVEDVTAAVDITKTAIDTLKTSTDAVKASVDLTKTAIDDTKTAVNSVATKTDDVKAAVNLVKTATDSTKTAVDSVKASTDAIQTKTDAVKAAVDAVKGSTDTIQSKVDTMNTDVKGKLDLVKGSTDTIQTAIADLPTTIKTEVTPDIILEEDNTVQSNNTASYKLIKTIVAHRLTESLKAVKVFYSYYVSAHTGQIKVTIEADNHAETTLEEVTGITSTTELFRNSPDISADYQTGNTVTVRVYTLNDLSGVTYNGTCQIIGEQSVEVVY